MLSSSSFVTRSTGMCGFSEMISAAAADAYGVAIELPVADAYAVGDVPHAETMPTPGADTSR